MRAIAILAGMLWVMSIPAHAQTRISALDLAVDWRSMIGDTVMVTGCALLGASVDSIQCEIKSKTGSVGTFWVDPLTMARDDLRRALNECAGFSPVPGCAVQLEGEVAADFDNELIILNATAAWPG